MAVHTKEQRLFIVRRLAAFYAPQDIVAAFALRFTDTACHVADIDATDPRLVTVDPDLHAAFISERERALLDPTLAPFADRRARLIALSRQAERCEKDNRHADARAVFRQIADEQAAAATVGGLGAVPGDTIEVTRITRTIVDPAAPAEATCKPDAPSI